MFEPDWQQPPLGTRPVSGLGIWHWIIGGGFAAALLAIALFVPIPVFYAYLPGPAPDVSELLEVSGSRTYSSEGTFLMTTVSVDTEVTIAEMVGSMFDPHRAVVMREQVTGGQSLDELRKQQEQQMRDSNRSSQEVALTALGFEEPQADGARITATYEGAPASRVFEVGDVIVKVDDRSVSTTCEVGRAIDAHEPGETVSVQVRRDDRLRTFRLRTIENPQDPGGAFIGIAMEDVNYRFEPGVDVEFDTGDIAGPSAGLMFSLSLYDQLTPDDLTDGKTVAGTGTIACDGGVGPIGGVEQKVAGAEREGADIFLAPALNADPARRVAGDIEIVAVSTFEDAVEYLEGLD